MAREKTTRRLRVAVTGTWGDLGSLLIPRLLEDPRVERVVALDVTKPPHDVEFEPIDLTRHDVETALIQALKAHRVDVLYHLAFQTSTIQSAARRHELEVIGSMHVLSAVAQANVSRLIVSSMTAVYGALRGHPALLSEDTPLHASNETRYVNDRVEVERQIQQFRASHPTVKVFVLRFAPVVGERVDNLVTRFFSQKFVPTVLGYDPPWQAIHESDAAEALRRALHADEPGVYNIVGRGYVPLSGMIRAAGNRVVPLPATFAKTILKAFESAGLPIVPAPFMSYLQYGWVADGRRAEDALGFAPRVHAREAVAAIKRS